MASNNDIVPEGYKNAAQYQLMCTSTIEGRQIIRLVPK